MRTPPLSAPLLGLLLSVCLFQVPAVVAVEGTAVTEGLRDKTPNVHALVGATLITAPGQKVENGTLVIRDGLIDAVGKEVAVPPDARIWDVAGKRIYAGFIDAYSEVELRSEPREAGPKAEGTAYWNSMIRPHWNVVEQYQPDADKNKSLRAQGFVARLVSSKGGVVRGTSSLVTTGDAPAAHSVVSEKVAMHMRLTVSSGRGRDAYPNSPMGAVALARQAMYDAQWYQAAWSRWYGSQVDHGAKRFPRPEQNIALQSLQPYGAQGKLVMIDASDEQYLLRADRFAREFNLNVAFRGSGHEYRQLDAVRRTGRAIIVPLSFPKPPNVQTPENAMRASLESMLHWDHAPENPARLRKAGVDFAFTTHGMKSPAEFWPALRKAIERGLSRDDALAAITTAPANIFGTPQLGTLEPNKEAHLVITDGDLFEKETKVLETWVSGHRYEVHKLPDFDLRGTWAVTIGDGASAMSLTLELTGKPEKLQGEVTGDLPEEDSAEETESEPQDDANDEDQAKKSSLKLKSIRFAQSRIHFTFPGKAVQQEGNLLVSASVSKNDASGLQWLGQIQMVDGRLAPLRATRRVDESTDEPPDADIESTEKQDEEKGEPKPASFPVQFPLGAFGRETPAEQPKLVAFTGATVWTCDEAGTMVNATVLIRDGRIVAVGTDVGIPADAQRIDVSGKHISPGIIDCHSHMATDGGINESTQAVTAEVRIGDFIDGRDINIYRQLAGGVTTSNILHGSANPIGGQNQVIKLRWGQLPEQMKFAEAPLGIKFALGENVKQSNWGDKFTTRYPQTRMGVSQIIRDTLQTAREYRQRQQAWDVAPSGVPPRRDLELDAIAEILEGKRWIHCHSYRQDEIVALLRVLEEYGVQIGTLQHILEGYKVADVMRKHGAMGSAFSDWWAYKFEVYDAIPYNGALMHNAGVVVSFNSDDQELARRLNQEAAKAVKYGGVEPTEALKFVTLNPAKQLRIDSMVGSIAPGKHADLVVWSAPPLSSYARCEQTWVDGRKYFDLDQDRQLRKRAKEMRNKLVQKILESGETMLNPGEANADEGELWPREDLFCGRHGHGHGGHDQ